MTESARILLLGGTGQVGTELRRALPELGTVVAPGRRELSLTDLPGLRRAVRDFRPEVVVNAAAYTAVASAEREPRLARAVNAEAPGVLAEEAHAVGALLVHYSTDYVFDGRSKRPYAEEDPTGPLNVYGITKLEGERAVRNAGGRHLIFRTGWVYGPHGKNFLRTILLAAAEQKELRIVDDQVGTPTSSRYVASATVQVLGRLREGGAASGTYHMTPVGQTTWYGFARRILEETGLDRRISLTPISSDERAEDVRRPAYSVLSSRKLEAEFQVVPPPFDQELEDLCRTTVSVK